MTNPVVAYHEHLAREPDAIIIFDRDGTYSAVSAGNPSVLPMPDKYLLGRSLLQIIQPPKLAAFMLQKINECSEKSDKIVFRYSMRNKSGVVSEYECECVPCRGGQVAAFLREISIMKDLEESMVTKQSCCGATCQCPDGCGCVGQVCCGTSKRKRTDEATVVQSISFERQPVEHAVDDDITGKFRILSITSFPLVYQNLPLPNVDSTGERAAALSGTLISKANVYSHGLREATYSNVVHQLSEGWDMLIINAHFLHDNTLLLEASPGASHPVGEGLQGLANLLSSVKHKAKFLFLIGISLPTDWHVLVNQDTGIEAVLCIGQLIAPTSLASRCNCPACPMTHLDTTVVRFVVEHMWLKLIEGYSVGRMYESLMSAIQVAYGQFAHIPSNECTVCKASFLTTAVLYGRPDLQLNVGVGSCTSVLLPERKFQGNLFPVEHKFSCRGLEMQQIISLLLNDKMSRVNIYGMPAVGKSELCRAIAWWLVDRGLVERVLQFANESDDEPRDELSLLTLARNFFDLKINSGILVEQRQQLYNYLQCNSSLILIDDWDSIEPSAQSALYAFLLQLPSKTLVLINGRDTLPPAQFHNFELEGLRASERTKFFKQQLHSNGYFYRKGFLSDSDTAAMTRLCDTLGGHPFALKLVANNAMQVSIEELDALLLKDLNESSPDLGRTNVRRVLHKHVYSVLETAYQKLSEPAAKVLRTMGILAFATFDDIEGSGVVSGQQAQAAFEELIHKSFVIQLPCRSSSCKQIFSLHMLVKQFAIRKLREADENTVALHCRFIAHLAQKATQQALLQVCEHLRQLAVEHNIRSAASLFFPFFRVMFLHLYDSSDWLACRQLTDRALQAALHVEDKVEEIHSALGAAELCHRSMRTSEARKHFLDALSMSDAIHDQHRKALSAQAMVDHHLYFGEVEAAHSMLVQAKHAAGGDEGLAFYDRHYVDVLEAGILMCRGRFTDARRLLTNAIAGFDRSLNDMLDFPSLEQCFSILHNLRNPSWLERFDFDLKDLDVHFFNIMVRLRRLVALQRLTDCLMFLGELQLAQNAATDQLNAAIELEHTSRKAFALCRLAQIARRLHDYSESAELVRATMSCVEQSNGHIDSGKIHVELSIMLRLSGDAKLAKQLALSALAAFRGSSLVKEVPRALLATAAACIDLGDFSTASNLLSESFLGGQTPHHLSADAYYVQGSLAVFHGQKVAAIDAFHRCASIYNVMGDIEAENTIRLCVAALERSDTLPINTLKRSFSESTENDRRYNLADGRNQVTFLPNTDLPLSSVVTRNVADIPPLRQILASSASRFPRLSEMFGSAEDGETGDFSLPPIRFGQEGGGKKSKFVEFDEDM